jgi:hypothetical protein
MTIDGKALPTPVPGDTASLPFQITEGAIELQDDTLAVLHEQWIRYFADSSYQVSGSYHTARYHQDGVTVYLVYPPPWDPSIGGIETYRLAGRAISLLARGTGIVTRRYCLDSAC